MIAPIFMAAVLVSTPEQAVRDDAATLGRDMAMGLICESIQAANMDVDALLEVAGEVLDRAEQLQIAEAEIDQIAENAIDATTKEITDRYPEPTDELRAILTQACGDLIQAKPSLFKAYTEA